LYVARCVADCLAGLEAVNQLFTEIQNLIVYSLLSVQRVMIQARVTTRAIKLATWRDNTQRDSMRSAVAEPPQLGR
jgi:hypothetical protein